MTVTFLSLDKEHWDFINSFANWISAFGTVSAVVVSLWLALRPERIAVSVSAKVLVVVIPGVQAPPARYIAITAVNRGKRVAKVTGIGWAYGSKRGKKRRTFLQLPGDQQDGMSSPIPVLLDDGQEAKWMYPKEVWLQQIDKLYSEDWKKTVNSFVVEVSTSVGQTFRAPIDQSLKDAMTEAMHDFERRSVPSTRAT
ncbi:hypothetical protein [Burkholderia gladioli]|uniref:hypothetical protein n=1 Tax=Burkholderia gladioli TaxID=28095 RepID=UPI001641BCEF|nr:hypothetical protein [Burkholderia gladioli]